MSAAAMSGKWNAETAAAVRREARRVRARFNPFEIAAMVLGFIVFWPVGLGILFWMLWKKRQGEAVRVPDWLPRIGPLGRDTGNSAFEDWKRGELERLEEERQKLAAAQQEFAEFLGQLKRAKDREEFDRFFAARNKPAQA
jgi:Protein of unknown function (DUF2852)